jgi:hypothetical protein
LFRSLFFSTSTQFYYIAIVYAKDAPTKRTDFGIIGIVKEATVITTVPSETTLLTWRTHRLREDRQCLPLVIGAYVLAIGIWWLFFPVPLALFLPLVALTSALSEFLFPVTYTLTSTGVSVVYGPLHRLHLAWEEIKRAGQGVSLAAHKALAPR